MPLLGYERWENFDRVISRAMDSCETGGIDVPDHFREVTKMVELGSGSKRQQMRMTDYNSDSTLAARPYLTVLRKDIQIHEINRRAWIALRLYFAYFVLLILF